MRNFILMTSFAALLAGCGPLALQHGAATVPKGKVAAGASTLIIHEIGQGDAKDSSRTNIGQSAGFVRWGFHDQMDAGLQVYPGGTRADIKLMFVNNDQVSISMNPGIHVGYFTSHSEDPEFDEKTDQSGFMTGYDMTFAVGMKVGGGNEVWVAPRFGSFSMDAKSETKDVDGTFKSDSTINYQGYGGGVGARLKMGEAIWLTPELGIYQRETKSSGFTNRGLSWVPAIGIATGF